MKTRILLTLLLVSSFISQAQRLTAPMKSPRQNVMHTMGITPITVDYHSPAVKGRTIWGELVPYGKVWRAGANENTVFSTADTIDVAGQMLPAGEYGLHIIPEADKWTLIFNSVTTAWGSYTYDESKDVLRVEMELEKATHRERMSFGFEDYSDSSCTFYLHWGELKASVPLTLDVHRIVLRSFREELKGYAGFFWRSNYQAAMYCLNNNLSLEEGLGWAKVALVREENFSTLRLVSEYHERRGEKELAEEFMQEALQTASEKDLVRYAGQLKGDDADRAIEVLKYNAKKHDTSWQAQEALADLYLESGDKGGAKKSLKKALKLAPEKERTSLEERLNTL